MVLSTGRVLEHWHTGAMTAAPACSMPSSRRRSSSWRRASCIGWTWSPGTSSDWRPAAAPIEVKVRADSDVPVGMVFMPFCYAEAAANLLTNPALDPTGKIPEFKFCAARVVAGLRERDGSVRARRSASPTWKASAAPRAPPRAARHVRHELGDRRYVVEVDYRHAGVGKRLIARHRDQRAVVREVQRLPCQVGRRKTSSLDAAAVL